MPKMAATKNTPPPILTPPTASGLNRPTIMVSTSAIPIQLSSASTTGHARRDNGSNSARTWASVCNADRRRINVRLAWVMCGSGLCPVTHRYVYLVITIVVTASRRL